jgi:hypothetical protein
MAGSGILEALDVIGVFIIDIRLAWACRGERY